MKARPIILVVGLLTWLSVHALAQKADGELITRTFKVDSTEMWSLRSPPATGPVVDSRRSIFHQTLQIQFAAAGIDFSENPFTPSPTDKAMFLNERTGELVVRATREDLQQIDRMVRAMQKQPPLVEIEVRFVETPVVEPRIPYSPLPRGFTNTSVYTEKQFRETIRRYENSRGVDIVTAPKVMTVSGRQARVGVEEAKPWIYQDPPKLPRDTSPDADPTPRDKGRLPFPPGFVPREMVSIRSTP